MGSDPDGRETRSAGSYLTHGRGLVGYDIVLRRWSTMSVDAGPATSRGSVHGMVAVCLGIASTIIPGFMLGSLFVEIGPDLHYGRSVSGIVLASFFGASAFLSAPLGRWVDRRGPVFCLRLALVSSASLQAAIALGARVWGVLALIGAAAGGANALCQVSSNVWIARFVPPHRQGIAFAAKQSSMPAAALVSGLAIPALAVRFGWRWAFAAGITFAILSLGLLGSMDDERSSSSAGVSEERAEGSLRPLLWLAVAAGLSSAAAVTLGSFFVDSTVEVGLSKSTAGLMLALGSAISITSRLIAGTVADRRKGNLLGLVAAMLAAGAVSYLVFAWRVPASHWIGLSIAFGAGWAWLGVFNLAVVRANPNSPGRATGITQSGTYVGASMGPLIFGLLADHASYSAAWIVAAFIAIGASLAVLHARRSLRSRGRRLASTHP